MIVAYGKLRDIYSPLFMRISTISGILSDWLQPYRCNSRTKYDRSKLHLSHECQDNWWNHSGLVL